MKNDEIKKFAISLAKASSEFSVINILKSYDLWDNKAAWRLFGDSENNFSTIGGQQSRAESAFVEKIINSVDSVLTSECIKKGINPEGPDAPKSIRLAVAKFFDIHLGMLSNITPIERTKLASRIGVVATGYTAQEGNGCYTIFDLGEGQTPNMMPKTFLSIGEKNKLKIPFVQGKFNMGGTGVLRFCGERNLQLIITKRNPEISNKNNDTSFDNWGFTIVKRVFPEEDIIPDEEFRSKSSRYVYLVNPKSEPISSKNVFQFSAESLPILPGKYPIAYEKPLFFGSFIKLYEYEMTGLKTNLTLDPYNRFSLLMPSLALPVRLYERRLGFNAHSAETTLNGLSVRLEEDKRNNLEDENWPSSHDVIVLGENLKVKVYAFKKDLNSDKKAAQKYVKDEGIIFTINGQTHGYLNRRFFHRKSIGLGTLSDSLIVTVDCTEISGKTREDLFMNSRDRLVDSGILRKKIEEQLEKILKEHQGLRDLKHRRHKEEISNKLDNSKPLADVIEKIMKSSPSLSNLFLKGFRIKNPFNTQNVSEVEKYLGKKFPSFFTLEKKISISNPKNCPINQKSFRLSFLTDVVNDYFDREVDKGTHELKLNEKIFTGTLSLNLWNGHANLNVEINDSMRVGDVLHFTSQISDISQTIPFTNDFYVKIVDEIELAKNKSGGSRKKPSGKTPGNKLQNVESFDLPNIVEVSKDDDNWMSKGFNEYSALIAEYNGEEYGYTFFINTDNIHLKTEQKSNLKIDTSILLAQYKYSLTIMGISMIKAVEDKILIEKDELDVMDMIKMFTSSISPVILPILTSLGELNESFEDEPVYKENSSESKQITLSL